MYIPEEEEIRREKAKARQLRASQWWKRKCARGVCHWCGKTVAPGDLTMDHVLPLARGGKTTKNNVVPCCKECNIRKKSRMPAQWDNP
ncbi:MAG: HNH endonuclease [Desulfobacterales bacterium]|nr:HNH endonuclease [Desulfobacterales bacterium]